MIGIIVLLVALLLPALAAAQQKARATTTTGTMEQFALACESFHQKFGYYPGVVPENILAADPKISGTENALLHLMGGFVREEDDPTVFNSAAYSGSDWKTITFGSGPGQYRIKVNRFKLGEGPIINGQQQSPFFSPKGSELRALPGQNLVNADSGDPFADDAYQLPDLADAWGQPIIYLRSLRESGPLVGASGAVPAPQFSRASMSPYLASAALGDAGKAQSDSVLNSGNDANRDGNLAQIIRHPAFGKANEPQSSTPKGRFIVISAGKDGVFFSKFDGPGSKSTPVTDLVAAGPKTIDEFDDLRRFGGG
ncbi:MAG: hypothetical protein U0575_11580 [Phycisphaerales bacterium]